MQTLGDASLTLMGDIMTLYWMRRVGWNLVSSVRKREETFFVELQNIR